MPQNFPRNYMIDHWMTNLCRNKASTNMYLLSIHTYIHMYRFYAVQPMYACYIYYSQLCGYSPGDLLALILRQTRSVLPQDHSRMAHQIPKPTEEGHLDNLATTGCTSKCSTDECAWDIAGNTRNRQYTLYLLYGTTW